MKSASLAAIGLVVSVLIATQPDLQAATKFDGSWSVTLDAKVYKNPDGSTAQPFVRRFAASVKDAFFHGEIGNRGEKGWHELEGKIEADGSANLRAKEILKFQKYSFTETSRKAPSGAGTPYTYQVLAHFDARRGSGKSADIRPRIFTFLKEE